jgi:hypothetical protein
MATTLAELLVKVGVDADELESGAKGAANDVEKSFDRAGREVAQSFDKAERAAKSSFDGIGQDAQRAGTKIEKSGDEAGTGFSSGLMSKLDGLGGKMSGFATDTLDDFKGQFALGGAAIGVALVAGLSEAMGREAGTDKLAAQLGLSPEESERAGRIAGELYGAAYGDSLGEVNDAVGAVMSTLETESEKATSRASVDALNLAATYDTDVVDAVALAGFTIEHGLADSSDDAFDLIVAAMQRMPAAMRSELFPIIEEYGGFLTSLGFTGEEAFGLIVGASEGGTFALDKTMDSLKEFQIRSTDMSTASVEAFDTIGLDAEIMAGRILAGGDTARGAFEDIVEGILAIENPVERANTAIKLFGTPIEDLAVDQIPAFLEQMLNTESSMGDVSSAAEDLDTTLNDNAQVRFEELKRTLIGFVVGAIDTYLLPAFDKVSRWAQDNPALFQIVAIAVGFLALSFFLLAGALVAVWIASLPITVTMLLIVGIIALVILAIILLIFYWDEVKAAAGAAWDFIKEKAQQAFDWIKTNWPLLLAVLTGPIGLAVLAIVRHWDTIKSGITAVKNWIRDRINDVIGFFTAMPGRIAGAAAGMFDGIKNAFKSAVNAIIGWWNGLSFTLPTIDIPGWDPPGPGPKFGGFSIGGQTFGTPNIPFLEHGGIITDPTLAVLGEGRFDEAVVPLPRGMRSLDGLGGPTVVINVAGSIRSDRDLVALIRDELDRGGLR